MTKVRTWVGLDVHAAKVLACVVDACSGEMTVHRLPGEAAGVVSFCARLPAPTRVAYEAGPTGFGLARALHAAGTGCVVAAPGKIERPAQDRVKTDRRDAERLVRLLMIDGHSGAALNRACAATRPYRVSAAAGRAGRSVNVSAGPGRRARPLARLAAQGIRRSASRELGEPVGPAGAHWSSAGAAPAGRRRAAPG